MESITNQPSAQTYSETWLYSGSYPQTEAIRKARREYRKGELSPAAYEAFLKDTIREIVGHQEALGLDVLVHGEPERTDMVEYFGQQLEGFCFTDHGWVQSYGRTLRARLCTEPHPKTHEGYAHRAGDYPVLELCA